MPNDIFKWAESPIQQWVSNRCSFLRFLRALEHLDSNTLTPRARDANHECPQKASSSDIHLKTIKVTNEEEEQ